ncbi:MAG TPA: peptidoglycan DD-metalloendopeptidase family protein [Clostridiaceae bacterium]|nr:peptidoglycan DD-metalloendopeptidase family protein [Clostridiaceae bacterium]
MISKNRSISTILLGMVCLGLCLVLLGGYATPLLASSGKTSKQLKEAQDRAASIKKEVSLAQAELDELQSAAKEKSDKLAWLEERTQEQQEAYEETLTRKNNALLVMEHTSNDYEAAVQEFEDQKQAYGERLALMYQLPKESIFEALLSSGDLQSYFSTNRLIRIISDTDELMLARLQEAEAYAAEMKVQAEDSYEDMQRLVKEADELLAEIKADRDISAEELKAASSKISEAEKESLAWAEEMKKAEQEIASLQEKYKKELAAEEASRKAEEEARKKAAQLAKDKSESSSPSVSKSGWVWPVPSSSRISSYYGYRLIFGARQFHRGIDIPAPSGNKIVSTKSGVVLKCSSSKNEGNYVTIDHGNGILSKYKHLSRYGCSSGQRVSAGQVIGYIGNTGRSTGPHLHFEIIINGKNVDPLKYLRR